jgi:hypothetical protein
LPSACQKQTQCMTTAHCFATCCSLAKAMCKSAVTAAPCQPASPAAFQAPHMPAFACVSSGITSTRLHSCSSYCSCCCAVSTCLSSSSYA